MITENVDGRTITRFGLPAEDAYGYPQGVRVGEMIQVSGQVPHDLEGNLIAPAHVDAAGFADDYSNMEEQMRATYANAVRVLAELGATLGDVVNETIFVLDMPCAFAAASKVRKVRKEVYGKDRPPLASDIIGVRSLAFPEQLIEISFRAVARK